MAASAKRIGHYRIEGEFGRGLATTVYRAVDDATGHPVALKVFHLRFLPGSSEEQAWQTRFLRETAAARLIDHPAVVRLIESGVCEGEPYVVLERVDGTTLADMLASTAMELARKLEIALQVAGALAAAHELGVLHLSLRPSNVFLLAGDRVKVDGFGELDLLTAEGATPSPGIVSDQVHYRAPEQIFGQHPDARTDVFTFGILLYELAYHKKPFEGDSWFQITHRILNQAPPRLRESSAETPLDLLRIIDRALVKEPAARYPNVREMEEDLRRALDAVRSASTGDADSDQHTLQTAPTVFAGDEQPALPGREAYLMVHDGRSRRTVTLARETMTLGRRSDNDIVFADESVSRYHAQLEASPEGWVVSDRRSRHGTFVNEKRINARSVLRDGDQLDLGHAKRARITFRSGVPGAQAPPHTESKVGQVPVGFLLDAAHALNSSLAVDDVLNVILDCALGFTLAERGFLMMQDEANQLGVRLGRQQGAREIAPGAESVSMSVVRKCIELEQPVQVRDASMDMDTAQQQSIVDLGLKAILCLPLVAKGKLLGVLYLDSRDNRPAFEQDQHTILQAFAEYAAAALENARLYDMAIRDKRTGLCRHDYFEDRLAEEERRALRDERPLALLFIDIDHFKAVNDGHGHAAGDVVLRAIGGLIQKLARASDLAARWGGEEFVLLAPGTDVQQARALAETMRENAAALQVRIDDGAPLKVTLSVGVAVMSSSGISTAEQLLHEADRAMYAAKQAGRNRVVVAPEALRRDA